MEKNIENNAVRDIVDDAQKKKLHNWILIPNIVLFVWAVFFVASIILSWGHTAGIISIGQVLFLFINIPLAILSFVFIAKKRVSKKIIVPLIIFAVLNIIFSIADWIFVILLINMP